MNENNLAITKNIEWRTVKIETEKRNQLLTYISTKNTTELKKLIDTGAKLVYEKIRVPLKSTNKKLKPVWKIRLEAQKKATKTGKNDKTKEKH